MFSCIISLLFFHRFWTFVCDLNFLFLWWGRKTLALTLQMFNCEMCFSALCDYLVCSINFCCYYFDDCGQTVRRLGQFLWSPPSSPTPPSFTSSWWTGHFPEHFHSSLVSIWDSNKSKPIGYHLLNWNFANQNGDNFLLEFFFLPCSQQLFFFLCPFFVVVWVVNVVGQLVKQISILSIVGTTNWVRLDFYTKRHSISYKNWVTRIVKLLLACQCLFVCIQTSTPVQNRRVNVHQVYVWFVKDLIRQHCQ